MTTKDVLTNCCTTSATPSGESSAEHALDSCCTTPSTVTTDTAMDELRGRAATHEAVAVRSAAFRQLLNDARPVTNEDIAAATGLDQLTIDAVLEHDAGRVELDSAGNIAGIAGLTINPTRHQLTIGDKTRWTWCALDAVGILGAHEADGSVESTDPATGEQIDIPFAQGTPDGDTTLFVLGGYEGGNAREDWCPLVNFFATRADAESWVADRGLEGDVVSVSEIAKDAAALWLPVTQPNP